MCSTNPNLAGEPKIFFKALSVVLVYSKVKLLLIKQNLMLEVSVVKLVCTTDGTLIYFKCSLWKHFKFDYAEETYAACLSKSML